MAKHEGIIEFKHFVEVGPAVVDTNYEGTALTIKPGPYACLADIVDKNVKSILIKREGEEEPDEFVKVHEGENNSCYVGIFEKKFDISMTLLEDFNMEIQEYERTINNDGTYLSMKDSDRFNIFGNCFFAESMKNTYSVHVGRNEDGEIVAVGVYFGNFEKEQ